MQIFVNPVRGQDGIVEWAMIELQGDLNARDFNNIGGKFVGDLHYGNDGSAMLIIGHHILFGKEQLLEKPFAVLRKKADEAAGKVEYDVTAMIRKKLTFRDRPKPIVSNLKKA